MQVLKYEWLLEVTENTEIELYLCKLIYATDTRERMQVLKYEHLLEVTENANMKLYSYLRKLI
jgi:hypothetical protein